MHEELKRKGVTKLLLWQEYLEAVPGGYQYSRFCERYARWLATASVTLRQEHRAGEKCFVDCSGDGVPVVDAVTGEARVAKLFVAVLKASNLTYVESVFSEDMATGAAPWSALPLPHRLAPLAHQGAPPGRPSRCRWWAF